MAENWRTVLVGGLGGWARLGCVVAGALLLWAGHNSWSSAFREEPFFVRGATYETYLRGQATGALISGREADLNTRCMRASSGVAFQFAGGGLILTALIPILGGCLATCAVFGFILSFPVNGLLLYNLAGVNNPRAHVLSTLFLMFGVPVLGFAAAILYRGGGKKGRSDSEPPYLRSADAD